MKVFVAEPNVLFEVMKVLLCYSFGVKEMILVVKNKERDPIWVKNAAVNSQDPLYSR